MRLMLGYSNDIPSLLVTVRNDFNPFNFEFYVINGAWEGTFTNGEIRVKDKYDNKPVGYDVKILTEEQDRLRGNDVHDYQTVFNNFHNSNYVGPEFKKVQIDDWNDDIPF